MLDWNDDSSIIGDGVGLDVGGLVTSSMKVLSIGMMTYPGSFLEDLLPEVYALADFVLVCLTDFVEYALPDLVDDDGSIKMIVFGDSSCWYPLSALPLELLVDLCDLEPNTSFSEV